MRFDILTLFPDIIYNYSAASILGRGQKTGTIKIKAHNFREWTLDKQRHVDDSPYGGGAGMVLQVEPIYRCLESMGLVKNGKKIKRAKTKIIIMDPSGKKFDQRMAEKFSKLDNLVIVSGRYEGFDERVYKFVDEKISIGDFVLAGGELPALAIVEATARLVPGVLGNEESLKEETFNTVIPVKTGIRESRRLDSRLSTRGGLSHGNDNFVEYPQYTRPENFMGMKVPKVLLSGNHKKIAEWRKKKTER